MNLNQLYYFKTVAKLQHFRQAANELNVSQPSLSPIYTHSVNGTISTLYDGKSQGLFLTECYDGNDPDEPYDGDEETSVPYKDKPRPEDISKGIYRINDAFANYNILLKKYGHSMKKIGFTKWKNTNN